MLYVNIGFKRNEIYNTSLYFNSVYENSWLDNEFAKRMLKEIDDSYLLIDGVVHSDVLGNYDPTHISSGIKTALLMMYMPENVYRLSSCGDNMIPFIMEASKKHDCHVCMHGYIPLPLTCFINETDGKSVSYQNKVDFICDLETYLKKYWCSDIIYEGYKELEDLLIN